MRAAYIDSAHIGKTEWLFGRNQLERVRNDISGCYFKFRDESKAFNIRIQLKVE